MDKRSKRLKGGEKHGEEGLEALKRIFKVQTGWWAGWRDRFQQDLMAHMAGRCSQDTFLFVLVYNQAWWCIWFEHASQRVAEVGLSVTVSCKTFLEICPSMISQDVWLWFLLHSCWMCLCFRVCTHVVVCTCVFCAWKHALFRGRASCCTILFFILAFGRLIFCCSAALCVCGWAFVLLYISFYVSVPTVLKLYCAYCSYTISSSLSPFVCTCFIYHQHSCLRCSLANVTVACHFCVRLCPRPFNHPGAQNYSKTEHSASLQSVSRMHASLENSFSWHLFFWTACCNFQQVESWTFSFPWLILSMRCVYTVFGSSVFLSSSISWHWAKINCHRLLGSTEDAKPGISFTSSWRFVLWTMCRSVWHPLGFAHRAHRSNEQLGQVERATKAHYLQLLEVPRLFCLTVNAGGWDCWLLCLSHSCAVVHSMLLRFLRQCVSGGYSPHTAVALPCYGAAYVGTWFSGLPDSKFSLRKIGRSRSYLV